MFGYCRLYSKGYGLFKDRGLVEFGVLLIIIVVRENRSRGFSFIY